MPVAKIHIIAGKHRRKTILIQLKSGYVKFGFLGSEYRFIDISYQGKSARNMGKAVVGGTIGALVGGLFTTALGAALGGRNHDKSTATLTLQKKNKLTKVIVKADQKTLKQLMRFRLYIPEKPNPAIHQHNDHGISKSTTKVPSKKKTTNNSSGSKYNTQQLLAKPRKLIWVIVGVIVVIAAAIAIGAYIALIAGIIGMVLYIVKYVQQKNEPVRSKPIINGQTVSRAQTRSAQRRAGNGNGKGKLSPVYKQWWFYCLIFAVVIFAWTGLSNKKTEAETAKTASSLSTSTKIARSKYEKSRSSAIAASKSSTAIRDSSIAASSSSAAAESQRAAEASSASQEQAAQAYQQSKAQAKQAEEASKQELQNAVNGQYASWTADGHYPYAQSAEADVTGGKLSGITLLMTADWNNLDATGKRSYIELAKSIASGFITDGKTLPFIVIKAGDIPVARSATLNPNDVEILN